MTERDTASPEGKTAPSPDPWTGARSTVREDVAAALAPRARTCPRCGAVETGARRTCSNCGAELVTRRGTGPSRRTLLVAAGAVVAIAAVVAAVVPGLRESAGDTARRAAERQQALEDAERERLMRDVRPVFVAGPARRRGEDRLRHRARLVAAGEREVTADARRRIAAGTIEGPVLGTECEPIPRTDTRRRLERDPTVRRLRYSCIAFKRRVELSRLEGRERSGLYGWPYWLVIDNRAARLTFCKITPRAGEGGRSLVTVPVPGVCQDPQRTRG